MDLILAIVLQVVVVGGLATWMVKKERRLQGLDKPDERRG
jgi:hypothetical protein